MFKVPTSSNQTWFVWLHKKRLYANIQDRLDFEISEIQVRHSHETAEREEVLEKLKDKTLKKAEVDKLTKRLSRLDDDREKMMRDISDANNRAQEERKAVDRVEAELLEMFTNPEISKRYFAIVGMDEIAENEFNLNIPRYVDSFEPEEEVSLAASASDLQCALKEEADVMSDVQALLSSINNQI